METFAGLEVVKDDHEPVGTNSQSKIYQTLATNWSRCAIGLPGWNSPAEFLQLGGLTHPSKFGPHCSPRQERCAQLCSTPILHPQPMSPMHGHRVPSHRREGVVPHPLLVRETEVELQRARTIYITPRNPSGG